MHNFQIQLKAPQINSLLKLITTKGYMLFKGKLKKDACHTPLELRLKITMLWLEQYKDVKPTKK